MVACVRAIAQPYSKLNNALLGGPYSGHDSEEPHAADIVSVNQDQGQGYQTVRGQGGRGTYFLK